MATKSSDKLEVLHRFAETSEHLTPDPVDHPAHYTAGKIEVWDFIVDQSMNYLEGNVVKYLCRYKRKGGLEDLKKARAYLDKLIDGL